MSKNRNRSKEQASENPRPKKTRLKRIQIHFIMAQINQTIKNYAERDLELKRLKFDIEHDGKGKGCGCWQCLQGSDDDLNNALDRHDWTFDPPNWRKDINFINGKKPVDSYERPDDDVDDDEGDLAAA